MLADLGGTDAAYGLEEGGASDPVTPWPRLSSGLLEIAPEATLPFEPGTGAWGPGAIEVAVRYGIPEFDGDSWSSG